MNIAIVDDNLSCANMVQKQVKKYFSLDLIQVFLTRFDEILNYPFDICFIDVRLGELDGIGLATKYTKLYPTCKIVFISNYDGLVYHSLEASLFFFIRKFNIEEDMQRFYKKYINVTEEENKVVEVISDRKKILLYEKDILYIIVARNICYVHTIGNRHYEIYSSLTKMLEKIDSIKFCQIDHHVVINIVHIRQVIGNKILMNDNMKMEVARRKRKDFMEKYRKHILNSI